jgi:hypothetical protein
MEAPRFEDILCHIEANEFLELDLEGVRSRPHCSPEVPQHAGLKKDERDTSERRQSFVE